MYGINAEFSVLTHFLTIFFSTILALLTTSASESKVAKFYAYGTYQEKGPNLHAEETHSNTMAGFDNCLPKIIKRLR